MHGIGTHSRASIALCLAVFLALAGCEPNAEKPAAAAAVPAPDETLDLLIPALVDAIQAKQPEFVMDHVAQAFKEDGGLDYYAVRTLVEKFAFRDEQVGARLDGLKVTPEADGSRRVSARVAFALGTRLAAGQSLPEGAVVYALDLVFQKADGRWQATGGRYARESPPATSPPIAPTETR